MKVSSILAVALATVVAAAPAKNGDIKDKKTRLGGINLTGMTEKEMKAVIAKVKKDPEVMEIVERMNGTSREEKMAVMDVGKKGLAYNNAGVLGPFQGRARYVFSSAQTAIFGSETWKL